MTWMYVCPVSEISTQEIKIFTIDGVKILVVKSEDNRIWAFDSTCTHADKSLEDAQWNPKNATLICPHHCAVFAISQRGLVLAPPAVLPLKIHSTQIEFQNSEPILMVDLDR